MMKVWKKRWKQSTACAMALALALSTMPGGYGGAFQAKADEPVVVMGEQAKTLTLDLTGGLTAGSTYMDGMVSVGTDMPYTSNYVTNKTNPNIEDGTGALVRLNAKYDGTIRLKVQVGANKKFCVHNKTTGDTTPYEVQTEKKDLTYDVAVEAGNEYYFYVDSSKMRLYEFSYEYEEKKEDKPDNVQTVKKEKTLKLLDSVEQMEAGKTYMDGMMTVSDNTTGDKVMKVSEIKGGVTATDEDGKTYNFTKKLAGGTGSAKPLEKTGRYLCFTPEYDGTVEIAAKVSAGKPFVMATVTGSAVNATTLYEIPAGGSNEGRVIRDIAVEAGETYYFYSDGAGTDWYAFDYTYEYEEEVVVSTIAAFPGAEGGGKFVTGGRGKQVYTVTNLNDSGEGSLRWALEESKKTEGGTIVFDVSGNIELKSSLRFDGVKNVTIAGQTAPGDGITVSGYDTNLSNSENIIIRYIRFRPGAINVHSGGDSMDAMWGRDNDGFIIDHCSFSWNTDECLSLYRGENGTVQWCMVYESLTLSGHSKGRHGYGAIAGGDNVTFHHNLYANHTSRNPRLGGGYRGNADADHVAVVQMSNNVIYNWGFNTTYGGGYTYTNFVNNYEVAGPGTRDQVQNWVINPGEDTKVGGFYIEGNYIANYLDRQNGEVTPLLTMDNIDQYGRFSGALEGEKKTTLATTPYLSADSTGPSAGTTNEGFDEFIREGIDPVETTFDDVLQKAGATYPRRDAIDARIAAEVENGLGRYVNTEHEVGNFLSEGNQIIESREAGWDTDKDGIPDDWETKNGLNPNDATDGNAMTLDDTGYTNLEVYLNSLVEVEHVAENPTAKITSPENNAMIQKGSEVTVQVEASSEYGHAVEKVEFYYSTLLETKKFGEAKVSGGSASCKLPELPDGSYFITARVYDSEGNATQTTASEVHINTDGTELAADGWTSADIGNVDIEGYGSLDNGVLTVKGNGKLGKAEGSVSGTDRADATKDAFHYVYKEITGDVEITAKLESISSVDNHAFAGIMIRDDLDDNAASAALGLSWTKTDESVGIPWSMYLTGRDVKGEKFDNLSETLDDVKSAEKEGIVLQPAVKFKDGATELGYWMRLVRRGNTFTAYSSADGETWDLIGSRTVEMDETVYVGFASESNRVANEIEQLNTARFSNVSVKTAIYEITYELENVEIANRPETVTEGNNISVTLTTTKGYKIPEVVKVKIGNAKPIDVPVNLIDPLEGILTITNVTGPVTITVKAEIDKTGIEQVSPMEIDNDNYMTVTEENGALVLAQTAEKGRITKNSDSGDLAQNISYYVFPKTTDAQTMELDVTILSRVDDTSKDKGLFVGVFEIGNGKEQFSSLGFRNVSGTSGEKGGLTGYWTKANGSSGNGGSKSNNGMPSDDPHTKPSYELNKTYHVVFEKTNNGYKVTYTGTYPGADSGVYPAGATNSPEMNLYKVFSDKRPSETEEVQYGMALVGVTAKIENLTLTDSRGRTIYKQNDVATGIAEEEVKLTIPSSGISKETILENLPAEAKVMFESGSYQTKAVTWDTTGLKDLYNKDTTITIKGTVEEYPDFPATIKVVLKKDVVVSDDDDDDDDDDSSSSGSSSTSSSTTSVSLSASERNKVNQVLGSGTTIQNVVENEAGKLIVSTKQEVVFYEKNGTLSKDKWQAVGGSWYYFGSDSKAVSGWLKTKDKWYFMDQVDKKMETGWIKTADGKWYLLDSVNGDMKSGWQLRGGKWYLLDEVNGDMKTGWQLRGGKWYLLDGINGDMKTGWQQTADGKWYYMNSSGEMAANTTTPDGYRVGPTGAWIR